METKDEKKNVDVLYSVGTLKDTNYEHYANCISYAIFSDYKGRDIWQERKKKSVLWKLKNLLTRMLSTILARVKGCISGI